MSDYSLLEEETQRLLDFVKEFLSKVFDVDVISEPIYMQKIEYFFRIIPLGGYFQIYYDPYCSTDDILSDLKFELAKVFMQYPDKFGKYRKLVEEYEEFKTT